jgi:DNA-binding MarR family transcriptional regulator
MKNEILAVVSEDLLSISPLIHRTIRRKLARSSITHLDPNVTPLHFEIMKLLEDEGTLHVSEIGEKLLIAKAQMTKLIDKLASLNIVERSVDAADRRTVNISLTRPARAVLKENKDKIMLAVQDTISSLTDEELGNLSTSLRNVRDILLKAQCLGS